LVSLVAEVLAEIGSAPDRIDLVAISDGPGSFTGLRVAAAWVKGLARVRPMPVRTASTLLVRAMAAREQAELVMGVGSALRGELFAAGYRFGSTGSVDTVFEPVVLAPGSAPPADFRPDAVVGDVPPEVLARWPFESKTIIGPPAGFPDAGQLIALVGLPGGTRLVADLGPWEPQYGRPAEAQAKWELQHGRALSDSNRGSG
jgi:tRNA threonylcarbamoyl adenosine modification protein YeaZ